MLGKDLSVDIISGTGFGTEYDTAYGLFTYKGDNYKIKFINQIPIKVQPSASNGYHLNGWQDSVLIRNNKGNVFNGIMGRYTYDNKGKEYLQLTLSTAQTLFSGPFVDSL